MKRKDFKTTIFTSIEKEYDAEMQKLPIINGNDPFEEIERLYLFKKTYDELIPLLDEIPEEDLSYITSVNGLLGCVTEWCDEATTKERLLGIIRSKKEAAEQRDVVALLKAVNHAAVNVFHQDGELRIENAEGLCKHGRGAYEYLLNEVIHLDKKERMIGGNVNVAIVSRLVAKAKQAGACLKVLTTESSTLVRNILEYVRWQGLDQEESLELLASFLHGTSFSAERLYGEDGGDSE